jgi:UDP-N-acetylglucosamine 2-epimerase (non-hydrolysing)
MRLLHVVGARPNFVKIGPIISALRAHPIHQILVHTGQHYDRQLSGLFFEELGLPQPDVNLGVGSGSHAVQTAEIMKRFEAVCLEQKPTHVLLVGDVNSTIACALVAVKLGIVTSHVEAGLRSFDRSMPEEINRILTDAISDILFTTEESANENLEREGVPRARIHFVGNVMIDSLLQHRQKADKSAILRRLGLCDDGAQARPYGVLTLHRPSTVDDNVKLAEVIGAVSVISRELPIIFPVHPRTRAGIAAIGSTPSLRDAPLERIAPVSAGNGIQTIPPLGYLDFLHLMSHARVVLTDSGGIQEETTILGVPCVTLRESTERPITLTQGTNVLAGVTRGAIVEKTRAQLERRQPYAAVRPPLWDGKAALRIAEILAKDVR